MAIVYTHIILLRFPGNLPIIESKGQLHKYRGYTGNIGCWISGQPFVLSSVLLISQV